MRASVSIRMITDDSSMIISEWVLDAADPLLDLIRERLGVPPCEIMLDREMLTAASAAVTMIGGAVVMQRDGP